MATATKQDAVINLRLMAFAIYIANTREKSFTEAISEILNSAEPLFFVKYK